MAKSQKIVHKPTTFVERSPEVRIAQKALQARDKAPGNSNKKVK